MKYIIPILIFLMAYPALSQPQLNIQSGREINWGTVRPFQLMMDRIWFTNGGDENIVLEKVIYDSTNMEVSVSDRFLQPGDSMYLEVVIKFPDNQENYEETIAIQTNSDENDLTEFTIKAYILMPLIITPRKVEIVGKENEEVYQSILLRNTTNEPIEIYDIQTPTDSVIIEAKKEVTIWNNSEYILSVKADIEHEAMFNTVITFRTTHPSYPVVRIPVYVRVSNLVPMPELPGGNFK